MNPTDCYTYRLKRLNHVYTHSFLNLERQYFDKQIEAHFPNQEQLHNKWISAAAEQSQPFMMTDEAFSQQIA